MDKHLLIFTFLFLIGCSPSSKGDDDFVTIKGYVTDYEGNPLNNVSVGWQDADFSREIFGTTTNEEGYYEASVRKGRYCNISALDMDRYMVTGSELPEEEQRLEFWGWNFIADRDTLFNIQYDRLEIYGVNVFQVQGGANGYNIFCRPMSLSRYFKDKDASIAPPPNQLEVQVTIDGENVPVRMVQPVKEYWSEDEFIDAYLLFVDPPNSRTELPYHLFRIQMTDLEYGDKGEATYHYEKIEYID